MIGKLRLKIIVVSMAIAIGMFLITFASQYVITKGSLEAESVRMMQAIAVGDYPFVKPEEDRKAVRTPYILIRLDENGQIAETDGFFDDSSLDRLDMLLEKIRETGLEQGTLEEYKIRFGFYHENGDCLVLADMTREQATLNSQVRNTLVVGFLSLVLFLAVSYVFSGLMVRPVEQAWKQMRQFIADASHELKTPVTVILSNAEILQAAGPGDDISQWTDSILTMTRHMRDLVQNLLDLAKMDSGAVELKMDALNFSQLVEDAVLPFEALYFERGLILQTETEKDIMVRGDRVYLLRLLDILLDNGQKYSEGDGEVRVGLRRSGTGRSCVLSVSTPGAPLTPEQQVNIFRRFYRVDPSRKMNGSYGLGLAIAGAIVKEHHGKIQAKSGDGCNIFLVELPAVPD